MSKKPFLQNYTGQTTDKLISLQDTYRVDSLVLAFEGGLDKKADRIGLAKLTPEERVILAIEGLEREVNNGGYHQFFTNSSVQYAPIVLDALERIGCPQVAGFTKQAIDVLGIEGDLTVEAIERVLEEADLAEKDEDLLDELDEIDEAYYEADENIEEALFAFIKEHKDRITLP